MNQSERFLITLFVVCLLAYLVARSVESYRDKQKRDRRSSEATEVQRLKEALAEVDREFVPVAGRGK